MSVVTVLGSVFQKVKNPVRERENELNSKTDTSRRAACGQLDFTLGIVVHNLWMMKKIFQSRYEIVNMSVKPDIIFITISAALLPAIGKN